MPILVTVSVSMADPVTLRELGRFVETAGRNGADPDADLREYDENNELVGLAAVGELESGEAEDNPAGEDVDEDVEDDEGDVDEDDGDNEDDVVDDESDEGQQVEQDEGATAATDESYRGS